MSRFVALLIILIIGLYSYYEIELTRSTNERNETNLTDDLRLEDHFASRRKQQSTAMFLMVCLM